jgi:hypothetical protein
MITQRRRVTNMDGNEKCIIILIRKPEPKRTGRPLRVGEYNDYLRNGDTTCGLDLAVASFVSTEMNPLVSKEQTE